MKKLAFTLAEVLVVIGIIGVVAAIGIPNLTSTTNDKEIVTRVKKVASEITTAYGMARAKYGTHVNSGKWTSIRAKSNRILEFMNVQTRCDSLASDNVCLNWTINKFDQSGTINPTCSNSGALLASGMGIAISDGINADLACYSIPAAFNSAGVVVVDIDGPKKGFNTVGIDVFFFLLSADGGIDTSYTTIAALMDAQPTLADMLFGSPAYAIVGGYTTPSTPPFPYKYWSYANWILTHDNVDYLHK